MVSMNESLAECTVCESIIKKNQIDGKCGDCGRRVCVNCKRVCDRCQMIFCMFDIDVKIVMRQQQPYTHALCQLCQQIW